MYYCIKEWTPLIYYFITENAQKQNRRGIDQEKIQPGSMYQYKYIMYLSYVMTLHLKLLYFNKYYVDKFKYM